MSDSASSPRLLVSLLVILVAWATIYLPGLGTAELKGEEARRILPGRTMLQTGDWIVPRSGGKIYNRKPPGINWAIASAIKITGRMDEWTVRLPSVLAMLALGIVMTVALRGFLGAGGALLAAIAALTNVSFIEKGRMAEIEGLYCALFGIAIVSWLALWWSRKETAAWCVGGFVLGIGFLVKGPPHVLYYYVVIIAVLLSEGRARALLSWRHFAGLVIFVATFIWWGMLNSSTNPQKDSGEVWANQITHRLGFSEFDLTNWLLQIPQGIANFLPWALLLPLAWRALRAAPDPTASPDDVRRSAILRGLWKGLLISFFVIAVLPSSRPRFMAPLNVVAAVVMAGVICTMSREMMLRYRGWWLGLMTALAWIASAALIVLMWRAQIATWLCAATALPALALAAVLTFRRAWFEKALGALVLWGVAAAITASIGLWAYVAYAVQDLHRDELRPFAAEIKTHTGPDPQIVLFRVPERMWPFYLGLGCREIALPADLPKKVDWVLTPAEDREQNRRVIENTIGDPVSEVLVREPHTDNAGGKGHEFVLWGFKQPE